MNEEGDAGSSSTGNTEDIANFHRKIELLTPMERRTAQAFLDLGAHLRFRWPVQNESKEEADSRKKLNSKFIVLERQKKRRSNETPDQRFTRLKDKNNDNVRRRSEETDEARNRRLEEQRQRDSQSRMEETEEARNLRLEADRERHTEARIQETEEARNFRLEEDRQRHREKYWSDKAL